MILRILEVGPLGTDCYIVGDEASKEGMIIDPGGDGDFIMEQVEASGLKIKTIVLTHAHLDHIGALAEVKEATGAEIAIHEDEAPSHPTLSHGRLLKEGDIITVGKLQFKVLHTPGHTRGGISLAGEGVVFTGDTLFNSGVGRADFPGSSYDVEMNSIRKKLMTLPDNFKVYPGHGPPSTIGAERRGNPFLHGMT
ncbi:MAG: MBL fold metallo-hydrolase [Dehalococcoidales bacterium]|nr:MBL fold metallo-hydrolase [Dehalococcoidales bacterium]